MMSPVACFRSAIGELRRGTERLQHGDGLARERPVPRIAHELVHADEHAHHVGGLRDPAGLPEQLKGLLVGRDRVAVSAVVVQGVAVSLEHLGPVRVTGRRKGEGALQEAEGDGVVEPECAPSGEHQEAEGRGPQLRGERLVATGVREVQGRDVVVGEDLGEVLDAVACLRLDPPAAATCRGDRRARGIAA